MAFADRLDDRLVLIWSLILPSSSLFTQESHEIDLFFKLAQAILFIYWKYFIFF